MWCAVGYMLENPVNPPLLAIQLGSSDNVRGAENQQERLNRKVQNPQRPYADHLTVPTVR